VIDAHRQGFSMHGAERADDDEGAVGSR